MVSFSDLQYAMLYARILMGWLPPIHCSNLTCQYHSHLLSKASFTFFKDLIPTHPAHNVWIPSLHESSDIFPPPPTLAIGKIIRIYIFSPPLPLGAWLESTYFLSTVTCPPKDKYFDFHANNRCSILAIIGFHNTLEANGNLHRMMKESLPYIFSLDISANPSTFWHQ